MASAAAPAGSVAQRRAHELRLHQRAGVDADVVVLRLERLGAGVAFAEIEISALAREVLEESKAARAS